MDCEYTCSSNYDNTYSMSGSLQKLHRLGDTTCIHVCCTYHRFGNVCDENVSILNYFVFIWPALKIEWRSFLKYYMGTNFRGWLNFAVFEGTSQTAKTNPGKIFVRLRPRKNTRRHWARQAREWRSFVTFIQPLTTEEKFHVLFSFTITCSLIHKYHRTTNPKRTW